MSDRVLTFYLRRMGGKVIGVYKVDRGVGYQWTPEGWKPQHFDWTGMGEDWADYDAVEVEEACQALLELGVTHEQLPAVILGLNLDGNLVRALGVGRVVGMSRD